MNIDIQIYHGATLAAEGGTLGTFRLRYFKEYPYLYAGTEEGEQRHLAEYIAQPTTRLLIARDIEENEKIAGIAIGTMLSCETEILNQIGKQLRSNGIMPEQCFYFGEMIFIPEYRNKGLGRHMLDLLKQSGREQGADRFGFLAVAREQNDSRRPADYVDSALIFKKLGFEKTDAFVNFEWQTIQADGSVAPTFNRLDFWIDR
jgi:ribosomal protein S18 acetylase RimI-like enzyme